MPSPVYTGAMANTVAVGAYLKTLREMHGLSRAEVAHAIETNEAQILRIERGDIDTRGSLLLRFVMTVRGSAEQLALLMTDPKANDVSARILAEQWLNSAAVGALNGDVPDGIPEVNAKSLYSGDLSFEQVASIIIDLGATLQKQLRRGSMSQQSTPLKRQGRRPRQRKKRLSDK